jgi:Protein of unknown function (DUF3024)
MVRLKPASDSGGHRRHRQRRVDTPVPDRATGQLTGHRDELRVECSARGKSITIFECRPPWHPDLGPDWARQPVAQLRYDPSDHHWRLYCADRNSRWHYNDMVEPTPKLPQLLNEIDEDPTSIFWG